MAAVARAPWQSAVRPPWPTQQPSDRVGTQTRRRSKTSSEAELFLNQDQGFLMKVYADDPSQRFILSGGGTFFISFMAACGYIRNRNNQKMLEGALDKLMKKLCEPREDPLGLEDYQRALATITSSRGKAIRRLVYDTFLRFFSGATIELEWMDTASQITGVSD